jgi:transposase
MHPRSRRCRLTESGATLRSRPGAPLLAPAGTLSELAAKYEIHPTLITKWKRQAIEGLSEVFAPGGRRDTDAAHEAEIKVLHAKIGQLTVEKDFLQKAFGR